MWLQLNICIFVDADTALIAMSLLGKTFTTATWQIIKVWGCELYPTTHRCSLSSLNFLTGRVGGVLAPLLLDLVGAATVYAHAYMLT